jgi:hypothetical protein
VSTVLVLVAAVAAAEVFLSDLQVIHRSSLLVVVEEDKVLVVPRLLMVSMQVPRPLERHQRPTLAQPVPEVQAVQAAPALPRLAREEAEDFQLMVVMVAGPAIEGAVT